MSNRVFKKGERVRYDGVIYELKGKAGKVHGVKGGWTVVDFDGGERRKCADAFLTLEG